MAGLLPVLVQTAHILRPLAAGAPSITPVAVTLSNVPSPYPNPKPRWPFLRSAEQLNRGQHVAGLSDGRFAKQPELLLAGFPQREGSRNQPAGYKQERIGLRRRSLRFGS